MKKQKGSDGRRGARTRLGSDKPWPDDERDQQIRDALARELFGACVQGLKTFGLDDRKLATLAAEATAGNPDPTSSATELLSNADRLGHAISKWSEEPAYGDTTGRPAVLSISGKGRHSFAKLAQEFFPGWDIADVIRLGCKNNVFERVGAHKVALLNNCVLYTGDSPLILASTVRTVRRVFGAANFNRHLTSGIPEGWPERAVWVEVSHNDFREFVRFIRPQINALLEMSNRWLMRRSTLPKNRLKKKRLSGIQVLVYRD